MKNAKRGGASRSFAALALGAGLAAAMAWYYDVFIRWNPQLYPCAIIALAAGVILLTLAALRARGARKALPLILKTALSVAVFLALLVGVSYIINNVVHGGGNALLAARVAIPLAGAQLLALYALLLWRMASGGAKAGATLAAAGTALSVLLSVFFLGRVASASTYLTREGLAPYQPAAGRTAIHFLNTSGGDAILLESGGLFAMIDAAEDSDNLKDDPDLAYDGFELYVLDYVKRVTGGRLDFILGTHAHSDHIGGFDTLLLDPEIAVGRAYLKRYDPAYKKGYEQGWDNQEVYDQMVDALAARGVPLIQSMPEAPFALGGFQITIFNGGYDADPSKGSGDENDNSMGVLVEYGGQRAFLAGDINNLGGDETRLAPLVGRVDLLKAPHHGHEGSSTAKFLSALRPRTVVVTTGPGGGNVTVLRRYDKVGTERILCTGDFGGVAAVFGAGGIDYYAVGEYPSGIGGANLERR
jgi:beta-lactamase superfamily II metal-dependent hydrolase